MFDKTSMFKSEEIESALINKSLFEIFEALEECGYKPINQITGYLITGDIHYITNYKKSRDKILAINRERLIATLVEGYFNK